ncbi:MAG: DUF4332 domain-containing protein [Anaerolineae bacterium]|nr:DUF4332 domain-containing protein [Anaerolineae bacterium]
MTQLDLFKGVILVSVAQAQQRTLAGIPLWVLFLVAVVVIIIAVIWFLYEEKQKKSQAETAAPPAAAQTAPPDDLKIIEGIGPKIAGVLQAAGITTLAQLAQTDVGRLRQILDEANMTALANPTSWPEQAQLAAAGDMAALQKLQDELKGGRRV